MNKKQKIEPAPRQIPWVEKYRPKTLDQVSSQDYTVAVLKKTLNHSNMAHMLFYGPPGTGKTSTILALARDLYGFVMTSPHMSAIEIHRPEMIKSRVLELNASDERGIAIVREKVKNFAKTIVTADTSSGGHPCPPYKIIILDEADSMTQDAQAALRRTMETYSKITRFCLICNYVTRIIEPLASRCSKFRFKPLHANDTRARLEYIALEEGVRYEDGVIEALIRTSEGDLRKAITYLQSAAKLSQSTLIGVKNVEGKDSLALSSKITTRSIIEIAGVVPDEVIEGLLAICENAQGSFSKLFKAVQDATAEGYGASQVMMQMHDCIVASEVIGNKHKNAVLFLMSETDKRLNDGADEHLQLLDLISSIKTILQSD